MQILINHLTRMQPGYICTAGLELTTGLHVRPVAAGGLTRDLLVESGGFLELGAVLDLGTTRFVGRTPEIEDRMFEPNSVRRLSQTPANQLLEKCALAAGDSVRDIFGDELAVIGSTRALPEHGGLYSLGCCWAADCELLVVECDNGPRLRIRWRDRDAELITAVADIRFFKSDHRTIRTELVDCANSQLSRLNRTVLAVGLSRPYRKTDSHPPMHWLQVNNVLALELPIFSAQIR